MRNGKQWSIRSVALIVLLGDSQTFRANWNILLGRLDIVNMGIPGDITPAMLTRVDRVIALHPRICFVQGGVNDINVGIPCDSTVEALSRIVRQLSRHRIKPVLHTVSYTSAAYQAKNPINSQIARLNEQIRRLARTEDIELIDMNRSTAQGKTSADPYVRQDDGLHYSYRA